MFRKMMKNFYMVALMLFTVGAFCFIPTFKSSAKNEDVNQKSVEIVKETSSSSLDSKEMLWQDVLNTDQSSTPSPYPTYVAKYRPNGYNSNPSEKTGITIPVWEIATAQQLAYVAYVVNKGGNELDQTNNFVLSTEISLDSYLWTPIGTKKHPFTGNFIGNGNVIQDIRMADISIDDSDCQTNEYSPAGLFGWVKGGNISDLLLGGKFSANFTNTSRLTGVLIGNFESGNVVNCFISNGISNNVFGKTSSLSKVYQGSKKIVTTITKNTQKEISSTEQSIENVGSNFKAISNSSSERVIYFTIPNNGIFFRTARIKSGTQILEYPKWYENNLYRVCYTGSRVDESVGIPFFGKSLITQRKDAVEGSVFIIYEGKINNPISINTNSEIEISFVKGPEDEVTFDYKYKENKRKEIINVLYNQTLNSFIQKNQYVKERIGYTFVGMFSDPLYQSGLIWSDNNEYLNSKHFVPKEKKIYPKFTHNEERGLGVRIAVADGDLSNIKTKPENSYVEYVLTSISATNWNFAKDNNSNSHYIGNSSASSDDCELNISLNKNYVIKNIGITDQKSIEISGKLNEYNQLVQGSSAKPSGVYTNFENKTETGKDYNTVNKNNDSYNPVTVSKIDNNGDDYTIKLHNIVGGGTGIGNVYIVVERKTFTLTLNTIVNTEEDASYGGVVYKWVSYTTNKD